ncbi:hypothetical protein ACLB1T_06200 [Escherichia coli]
MASRYRTAWRVFRRGAKPAGNLAAGGRGEPRPLTESDWKIARQIGPTLKEKGLIFVGLDIIGDRLTEINVTSPTCIREIEAEFPGVYYRNVNGCHRSTFTAAVTHLSEKDLVETLK